jgi:hypothetical protein
VKRASVARLAPKEPTNIAAYVGPLLLFVQSPLVEALAKVIIRLGRTLEFETQLM